MKKFLSIFAVASMMLAVGCADDLSYDDMGDTEVTFSINLPDLAEDTRVIADGTTATQLYYAVYDNNKQIIPGLTPTEPITLQNKQHQLKVRLVKGLTYNFAFWAEPANDSYYTFDKENAKIVVAYKNTDSSLMKSNDEMRDAFYATVPNYVVGQTQIPNNTIYLRRPFAQVNVGTTLDDEAAAETAGIDITKSKLVFTDIPNELNMWDGSVNSGSGVTVEFDLSQTPAKAGENLKVKVDGVETDFHYVAMSYILAPADGSTTNVTFTVATDTNSKVHETTVPSANYKRNYRTNIVGSIFTAEADFIVVVDEKPQGDIDPIKIQ